MDKTI